MRRLVNLLPLLWLCACSSVDVLMLGEQHDAPRHQQIQRETIESLATRGRLAAVLLEMAEQGATTAGLPPGASEAEVQQALRWDDKGWPWAAYGPGIMAAVRAGVPVLGANLPRSQIRAAMADSQLDSLLPASALAEQHQAVRDGHCGLLPESQIAPMARVQIARDRSMAGTVARAAATASGKTVVLLAGARHIDSQVGVPRHLGGRIRFQATELPPEPAKRDYCAEMRNQLERPRAP